MNLSSLYGVSAGPTFRHTIEMLASGNVSIPQDTADGYVYITMTGGGGGAQDQNYVDGSPYYQTPTDGGDTTFHGTLLVAKGGRIAVSGTGNVAYGGDFVSNIPGFVFTAAGAQNSQRNGAMRMNCAFGGGVGGRATNTSISDLPTFGALRAPREWPYQVSASPGEKYAAGGGALDQPRWSSDARPDGSGGGGYALSGEYILAGGGAASCIDLPVPVAILPTVVAVVIGAGGLRNRTTASNYNNGSPGSLLMRWN